MAHELAPDYAANLASDVYQAVTAPGRKAFVDLYSADMELGKDSMVKGVTGAAILSKPHVMGEIAAGKGRCGWPASLQPRS